MRSCQRDAPSLEMQHDATRRHAYIDNEWAARTFVDACSLFSAARLPYGPVGVGADLALASDI